MSHPDYVRGNDSAAHSSIQECINREHRACLAAGRSSVEHAVRAGELLIEAKAAVGHGGWLPWLESNFIGSADTAQTYMRLARHKSEVIDANTERARYLSVREAMAAIAPPEPEPPGSPSAVPPPYGKASASAVEDDAGPGPVPREPLTRYGEVLVLGDHRLLCADATVLKDVRALAAGQRAACMWTDPPWGVAYAGKTKAALRIRGDCPDRATALLADALVAAEAEALAGGSPYYIVHPAGRLAVDFGLALRAAGWRVRQTLVWGKDRFALGHSDYHYRHEPIYYGYSPGGDRRRGRGAAGWYGGNDQDSLFEVKRPAASREHPTTKPVELIAANLRNSTRPGDLVYDPFCGSGSVIIACELLGRRTLALEIDPRYCDVICARWQRETGVVPVVGATGEPRDYLHEEAA